MRRHLPDESPEVALFQRCFGLAEAAEHRTVRAQVEAGAKAVDINLGPRKKDWAEVFPWVVEAVETVVNVPLSIDTTNVDGMEAALKTNSKVPEAKVAQDVIGVMQ